VFEAGSQYGGDIVKGIVNLMQQHRMEAIANQILNTRNPPRAALVGQGRVPTQVWDNPATWQLLRQKGLGIQGTEKATGGTLELALRNEQAKADLAAALQRAKIANELAKVQGTGRYAPKQQTPTKAADWHQSLEEQKQLNAQTKAFMSWQEKNALDTTKLAQHFDKIYGGKGSAEAFYNAVTSGTGVRGNIVNGQFIPDDNGEYYTHDADTARGSQGLFGIGARPATSEQLKGKLIKYNDLQAYIDKAKQIEDAGGKLYPTEYPKEFYGPAPRAQLVNRGALPGQNAAPGVSSAPRATLVNPLPLPSGVSPELPVPSDSVAQTTPVPSDSGAKAQLPTPQTQDDYDAIPSGSDFIDVDGIQKTKT
jgi:hypothetical protein